MGDFIIAIIIYCFP